MNIGYIFGGRSTIGTETYKFYGDRIYGPEDTDYNLHSFEKATEKPLNGVTRFR